jgi:hypothetical protein
MRVIDGRKRHASRKGEARRKEEFNRLRPRFSIAFAAAQVGVCLRTAQRYEKERKQAL